MRPFSCDDVLIYCKERRSSSDLVNHRISIIAGRAVLLNALRAGLRQEQRAANVAIAAVGGKR